MSIIFIAFIVLGGIGIVGVVIYLIATRSSDDSHSDSGSGGFFDSSGDSDGDGDGDGGD